MFTLLGSIVISVCEEFGQFGLFCFRVTKTLLLRGCRIRFLMQQIVAVGVGSIFVVILSGTAIGAVLAIQGYTGLHRFGGAERFFLGPLVYLSMSREFGSIVSAIMVIGRAGSAMTAEIGSMNISEQIDALITLSIDPIHYVVIPRVVATTIAMPILNLFCVLFGVSAGFMISVYSLGMNAEQYIESIHTQLIIDDIYQGIIKACLFGLVSALICTYKGINARGGAKGLGEATTQSVVISCVTVLLGDYLLDAIFFIQNKV